MASLEGVLRQGLLDLKLALGDQQVTQLLDYLGLLQKWTRVYNLTAVRDPADMLTQHLLDCLAVIAPLRARLDGLRQDPPSEKSPTTTDKRPQRRLLDVGSGAGLPGVVVAICCPDVRVDCVDTVAKKVAFIRQAAATLGLLNLRGLHARVETLTDRYDVISSRAFSSLADLVRLSSTALDVKGAWLAMKGRRPDDEIALLPAGIDVFHVEQLLVPGLDAQRCLVWMRKT